MDSAGKVAYKGKTDGNGGFKTERSLALVAMWCS